MLRALLSSFLALTPNPLELYYLDLLQETPVEGGPTRAEAQRDYQAYLQVCAAV